MARYRFQSRDWLVSRIKQLEDQLSSGLKSISSPDGSTSFVSRDEAKEILSDLYDAVSALDGEQTGKAVFKTYRLMRRIT